MAQNFVGADRGQVFLVPPSLRDWLPQDHLAWWVIDAVAEMDLSAFMRGIARMVTAVRPMNRRCWHGGVALRLRGRGTVGPADREGCVEDVAFRVLAGNLASDHVTICRFRQQHQDALAGLFGQVLRLCAKAGMVSVGTIAVDGTRVAERDGRLRAVRAHDSEEAAEVDAAEDEQFGDRRGDELPEKLTDEYRRRAWLREAVRELERERAEAGEPVKRDRGRRLREAKRRMDEELWAQQHVNAPMRHGARCSSSTATKHGPPDQTGLPPRARIPRSRRPRGRHVRTI